jgi:DNA-binding transcriptional LysR family regulator
VARHLLAPNLLEFWKRFPRIQIELRDFEGGHAEEYQGVDIFLLTGWNQKQDLINKVVLRSDFWLVAAPSYLAKYGTPLGPTDLATHNCLLLTGYGGTVMDLWQGQWHGKHTEVVVNGGFVVSNKHRDVMMDACLAGAGIVRSLDWAVRKDVQDGRLVRILSDWSQSDAPTLQMLFRPIGRQSPRVRAVVDYIVELGARFESRRGTPLEVHERPAWGGRGFQRSSQARTVSRMTSTI